MSKRSKEVTALAVKLCNKLLPELDEIAKELEDPMEISHLLAGLDNRLAILLITKTSQKFTNNE